MGYLFNSDENLPKAAGADDSQSRKKTSRPPRTGEPPTKGVRISIEPEAKIIAKVDRQADPNPSRSEAVGRLIEKGLAGGGTVPGT